MPEKEICESEVLIREAERKIEEVLETLPDLLQKVIIRRFFLKQTLAETGKFVHLSAERVRQKEAKALRMLRHPTRIRQLEDAAETFGFIPYE